jgi:hypothetical protein
MIMNILKISLILCAAFMAMGAKSTWNYSYLMTHSEVLESAVKHCEQEIADPDCLVVRQAVMHFANLVAERRNNAQAFGKQILANQTLLIELQTQLDALNPDAAGYVKAKEAYAIQLQKVNILLSVVSATSMN